MNEIVAKFDYAEVAPDIADFLKEQSQRLKNVKLRNRVREAYETGEILKPTQEKLASHRNGTFYRWCKQEGYTEIEVKRAIQVYDFIGTLCTNKDKEEYFSLPITLMLEASKRNAPEELKNRVANGDILTNKQWQEEKKAMQDRLAEVEEQAKQAKDEAFVATNDKRRAELRAEQMEKSNESLRNKCDAQAQEIQELKDNPVVVETPADPEYIAQLKDEAAKAKVEAKKANRDYETLQDRFEDLNKKAGDLMRERDKNARMAEEIAGELKQAQELNNRLLTERQQPDSKLEIALLLATAARQINDENLELCVRRILRLNDGETILRRFKEMADIACIKGD